MSIMPKDLQASDIYNQLALVSGLSDQQLQQVTQDPSLGWMAGIVAQQRAEMRTPTPPQPQGTVIGNKLAQLQAPQGLPAGMGNQQAMMGMAQANPMAAGIAAAPENVQGAATGGLMALAQGGPVRGFAGTEGSQVIIQPGMEEQLRRIRAMQGSDFNYSMTIPDKATTSEGYTNRPLELLKRGAAEAEVPFDEWAIENAANTRQDPATAKFLEESPMGNLPGYLLGTRSPASKEAKAADQKVDKDTGIKKNLKVEPTKAQKEGIKAAQPDTQKVAAKGPGIPAAKRDTDPGFDEADQGLPALGRPGPSARPSGDLYRTINDPETSSEKSIMAIQEALGTPYAMSAELKARMEKEQAESAEGRMVRAALSGIGAALATPTEHASRAIGTGLVAGVNQFQQEQDPERLRNAMLQEAMTEDQAGAAQRKEAGLEFLKQKAASKLKGEEHQFQLIKQNMANSAKIAAASIQQAGKQLTQESLAAELLKGVKAEIGYGVIPESVAVEHARRAAAEFFRGGAPSGAPGPAPIGRLTSSGLQFFNQPS